MEILTAYSSKNQALKNIFQIRLCRLFSSQYVYMPVLGRVRQCSTGSWTHCPFKNCFAPLASAQEIFQLFWSSQLWLEFPVTLTWIVQGYCRAASYLKSKWSVKLNSTHRQQYTTDCTFPLQPPGLVSPQLKYCMLQHPLVLLRMKWDAGTS